MDLNEALQKQIKSNFPFEPTMEQSGLIDQLVQFYVSPHEHPLFLIKGYAGTGKTTLLSAFVNALSKLKRKTVLLAPTGRAAKVFSQRSKKLALTIHKKIYRKQTVAGGGVRLVLSPNLHTNTLFIIDEASMIADYSQNNDGSISPRNLLEDIVEYVFSGKNCKLIFIGDNAQLPPVGSDYSPALDAEFMMRHFPKAHLFDYQLKEVLRQATDSDILLNATGLRSAPDGSYPTFEITGDRGLYRINGDELQDALEDAFSNYGKDDTLIITRSNKRANAFNQQIRNRILWFDERIVGGDHLMAVKNNYFWLTDQSEAGFIANGELLKVRRIRNQESLYGFDFADAQIELVDYPNMDVIEVKLLLDVLEAETPNLSRDKMKEFFFAVEEDYKWEKNKKKRYERIMADPYFNALQVKFAYAITCHKSQGGQWPCVFVDQGFLTEEQLDRNYFRWLYTAFTRATEKLFLVNFHPSFFGDKEE